MNLQLINFFAVKDLKMILLNYVEQIVVFVVKLLQHL